MEIVLATKYVAGALAILPMFGVGVALGSIFSSMINVVGCNPGARNAVFPLGLLAFALTEAIALFALLISFLILFV